MRKLNKKIPNSVVGNSNILPQVRANLSTFDLSESLITTIGTDYLFPVYWTELQPNDHFEISIKSLARIMPMVAPPMTNVKLKFFAFYVPNRVLWKNWLNFMGEETYQGDNTQVSIPQISMNSSANVTGGLADYLGVPPTTTTIDYTVSALPFRAYNKIWNDWFKANMIQESVVEYSDNTNSEETLEKYKLLKKGKPLDYFTSCLPQPIQVDISLASSAPVMTNRKDVILPILDSRNEVVNRHLYTNGMHDLSVTLNPGPNPDQGVVDTGLFADMSKVTGLSIESLRRATALQTLLEKDMRSGGRYIDMIHEHFGTDIPDFLLGRSEFLGSTTTSINLEPILQNSETSNTPQGNMAAVGFGLEDDKLCEFSSREHGHLMILATVESDVVYQQGLDRKFSKRDRFDYYFPEFANLGEQPVMEKEIFLSSDSVNSNKVFGYTPRYRELREGYDKITGLMRSNVTDGKQSLDVWHLGQKFSNAPKLNSEFIESNTPLDRVVAVPSEDDILLNVYFDIKATRSVPVQSNPSILAGRV